MTFKCTFCRAKLVQSESIPIVLENKPHTADGYFCPNCEVVFFKNREFKRRKEALVHMEAVVGEDVITTNSFRIMCICGDPYLAMTTIEEDRQNIWIDGKKYKTWAYWCANCGTVIPFSVRQIRWQKTQAKKPFKIRARPRVIGKAKFEISLFGNKCKRRISHIMLDDEQVEVTADIGKGCYAVYLPLSKKLEPEPKKKSILKRLFKL